MHVFQPCILFRPDALFDDKNFFGKKYCPDYTKTLAKNKVFIEKNAAPSQFLWRKGFILSAFLYMLTWMTKTVSGRLSFHFQIRSLWRSLRLSHPVSFVCENRSFRCDHLFLLYHSDVKPTHTDNQLGYIKRQTTWLLSMCLPISCNLTDSGGLFFISHSECCGFLSDNWCRKQQSAA